MQLSVVGRMIAGFAMFGCLLLITNVISYFGLADIRQSAETVVNQKMPVQSQMLTVQTGILTLAKISTSGFNKDSLDALSTNRQTFDDLSNEFTEQLSKLDNLIRTNRTEFLAGKEQALEYIERVRNMYLARNQQLTLHTEIQQKANEVLNIADEASALMMDLSYLESDAPTLETLIGTGTNIDNKILPILNTVKEYITVNDISLSETIKSDIQFSLSNIEVESNYLYRLAEAIETDGIVDSYKDQYKLLVEGLTNESGLIAMQEQKISLVKQAAAEMAQSEQSVELAIGSFSKLFKAVNSDTLDGQNAILDSVQSNIWKSVVIMLVALVFVIILGVLAARSIAVPLAKINRSLRIISKGDLTHKADSSGGDEFSKLATSVNVLSESLHEVVSQINEQEAHLEKATRASVELGDETLKIVATQQQHVDQTASNTQIARETSQSNLNQIKYAMEQLDQVSQESKDVSGLVNQSFKQISDQAVQAENSSKIIHRLDDNGRKIGSILDVIKTIAEQTNLLALNAAIEAARAGEQGRGFAVVADEVRTLANRTSQSTEEIEAMIGSLQSDAGQAVQAIQVGNEQAEKSVGLIEKVTEQVLNISKIISGLTDINQQIVNDTNEQDDLLQSVDQSLLHIVELAKQSAIVTKQSNEATQQVDELMLNLKQAVSKFKL